jgi:hypothetical protein
VRRCGAARRWRHLGRSALWLGVLLAACTTAWAQDWEALGAGQRAALAPLQPGWERLSDEQRGQWLAVADRFPTLSAVERQRLQARMLDWARRSPDERGAVRLQFHEAQRWSPQERQDRWREYQSLDPQARLILAHRWKLEEATRAAEQAQADSKRNLVENPPLSSEPPRTASPTTVRARSGATSQPIPAAPAPPPHQQPGLPKVAATPTFVDRTTLLPRRGPQAAGVTRPAAAASEPD